MASAWGGSWGTAWLQHWEARTATPVVTVPEVGRGRNIPRATIIRYKGEEYIAESDAEAEAWIKTIREHELKKLEKAKQAKANKPPPPVEKPAEFKIQSAPQPVRDYAAEAQQMMAERYQEALRYAAEQKKAYEKWIADDDADVIALVRMLDV